ncbi:hypothetical protein D6C83_01934 [Aureobasidium pullulans]|uniref:Uncharacterized protein n=1 Tax=Aureobasidium pullulans TaxID=5580 RepID=A0A4V4LMM7_AURPU|nr:hypothetical protein D6C83_01934 [Aureobasidium pullulans]
MSKRTQSETPTEDGAIKRPRLDIQEQIKRAGILAEQLRNTVGKDNVESKTTAANQIASEELVRIFESLQEKTADTSESVVQLIIAQIRLETGIMMNYIHTRSAKSHPLGVELAEYLTPASFGAQQAIIEVVQKKMENVSSGDYVAKIKEFIKEALLEKFLEGISKKFDGIITGRVFY